MQRFFPNTDPGAAMSQPLDFDSPWKEILDAYLAEFFAFFFPQVYAEIDWTRPVVPLDKELQQVVRDTELGRRLADKLVQVWRRDGQDAWVLIHIEVQGQEEPAFTRRMFSYYYRLLDRYDRQIMSIAVLGDEREGWRPREYTSSLWGCEARFHFPTIKLLDYQQRWTELEANANPFATVVLAHLTAQATRRDLTQRARTKFQLTRRLYELGYARSDIIRLFHFIDWLLQLPDGLNSAFWRELTTWEEAQRMPYISSVERIGIEKGLAEGIEKGRAEERLALVLRQLERRFSALPGPRQSQVIALSAEQLLALSEALLDFTTDEDLTVWLAAQADAT
jgi:hypothetical protein